MIPKKIHYCWLSGDPFPELIANCYKTWQDKLGDYELVLWDLNHPEIAENPWVLQAFETKKYAFAADFVRLYALYHHGGIYLDTDVEVLKPFDDLLHKEYFVGSEGEGIIEAGVLAAQKGQSWLKDCLDHYEGRSIIKSDGTLDTMTLPRIMMKQITAKREIVEVDKETFLASPDDPSKLLMLPKDFFCAKNHGTGMVETTANTYCVHHFAMSWISKSHTFLPNFKRKLMKIFGVGTVSAAIRIFRLRQIRDLIRKRK